MNRAKLIFNRYSIHRALGLPEDVSVAGFDHSNDPSSVTVLLDGERFPEIFDDEESPIVRLPIPGSAQ